MTDPARKGFGGGNMKTRISFITLGVDDLEKSLAFYCDGMSLRTEGIIGTEFEDGAVVFFKMNDNLLLALFPRTSCPKTPSCR
jgi:catechol 2,3-dioxygenase-like lactoylglutathione lyase family enzyme